MAPTHGKEHFGLFYEPTRGVEWWRYALSRCALCLELWLHHLNPLLWQYVCCGLVNCSVHWKFVLSGVQLYGQVGSAPIQGVVVHLKNFKVLPHQPWVA